VGHIPEIVYRQHSEKDLSPAQQEESSRTVSAFLEKHGGGVVDSVSAEGVVHSRRVVTGKPLVSIVIPTQGRLSSSGAFHDAFVVKAVTSIIEKTSYEHFEIDLVVDVDSDASVMAELASIAKKKLRVHLWDRPFNFSQKMNYGVVLSRGDFVLLLNDDVEVINETWLENMVALAQLPNAGMVGAMLYYEDDTIQHAGHAYYQGSPTHIGLGLSRGSKGPNSSFLVDRKVSGVTAACALMPRHVFMEAGGFSALLPGNFNDVDLCLKVGSLGNDIYWTPNAELYHYESKTRDAHVHYYELDVIEQRWGLKLDDSRFWRGHPFSPK
jgi:glycosyltransferase involved in cell wall biosynthesis